MTPGWWGDSRRRGRAEGRRGESCDVTSISRSIRGVATPRAWRSRGARGRRGEFHMGKIIDSDDRYVCARPVYNAVRTRARATNPLHVQARFSRACACECARAPSLPRPYVRADAHARIARIHAREIDARRTQRGVAPWGFDDDIDFPRANRSPLLSLTAGSRISVGFKSGLFFFSSFDPRATRWRFKRIDSRETSPLLSSPLHPIAYSCSLPQSLISI